MRQSIAIALGTFVSSTLAKPWNDTGKGSIIFEEAFSLEYPELERTMQVQVAPYIPNDANNSSPLADQPCQVHMAKTPFCPPVLMLTPDAVPVGQTYADLLNNLADIHNQRLRWMDEAGVDYMVLSLTSPGIQGISNVRIAERVATQANDDIAAAISNNTVRFGAFAALSMHNATQAALELRRCVEELGFHGALLNDFQQASVDNSMCNSHPCHLRFQYGRKGGT